LDSEFWLVAAISIRERTEDSRHASREWTHGIPWLPRRWPASPMPVQLDSRR